MRRLWLIMLVGCWSSTPRPAPPAIREAAGVEAAPSACAQVADADALRARTPGHNEGTFEVLELDGDPGTVEAGVRKRCMSGLRCRWELYAQRDGCWKHLGELGEMMSTPHCQPGSTPGSFCTISGMRLMIHGDAQEYLYRYRGGYFHDEPGTHHVDGPSKRP